MSTATRKCTGCKDRYPQSNDAWVQTPKGKFHNSECLYDYAGETFRKIAKKSKVAKQKAWNERKKKIKGLTYWIKKTKLVAQEYAALRDHEKPCPTCGMSQFSNQFARWDGGHYRSVGSEPSLQLNLNNIHGQCRSCNSFNGGMPKEYEAALIIRLGQDRVDWLNGPHPAQHWDYDYLRKYRITLNKKIRKLKKKLLDKGLITI